MSIKRIVILLSTFFLILVIDALWLSYLPQVDLLLNVTLVTVIAITIGERLIVGLVAAIIAGIVFSLFSAVSGPGYLIAFTAAVATCWLFSHRIVTTRSAISFVSTISVGTLSYALGLIVVESLLTLFNRQRIHLDLLLIAEAGVIQAVVHPLLLSVFWRLFGRHQYHRLPSSPTQSF